MGIEAPVVEIVALLLVAEAAVKDYGAEARKSPTTVHPDSSLDPCLRCKTVPPQHRTQPSSTAMTPIPAAWLLITLVVTPEDTGDSKRAFGDVGGHH